MGHPSSILTFPVYTRSAATGKLEPRYPYGNAGGGITFLAQQVQKAIFDSIDPAWWNAGQLLPGAWQPKDLNLADPVFFPRPDSETGILGSTAFAPHRVCYRDGVEDFKYIVQPLVFGLAEPVMWHLEPGNPSWLTIPYPFYRGVDANGDTLPYGWCEGVPDQDYASGAPCTISMRYRDQAGQTGVITWTMYTTSSTTYYRFVSQTGSDSNGGTRAAPYATLGKVTGATASSTTFPKCNIVIRGSGTPYAQTAQTGGTLPGTIYLDPSRTPINFMAWPGEDVQISLTNGQFRLSNCSDGGFLGAPGHELQLVGSSSVSDETHGMWMDNFNRFTLRDVYFVNPVSKVNNRETNSTSIHTASGTACNYLTMTNCKETGRTVSGGANNQYLLFNLFAVQYSAAQFCIGRATVTEEYTGGLCWKDSNHYFGNRFCTSELNTASGYGSGGQAMLAMDQSSGSNGLMVGCKVMGGYIGWNLQSGGSGPHWSQRCTVYSAQLQENMAIRAFTTAGSPTFFSKADVLIGRTAFATGNVTVTLTEANYLWNSDGLPGGVNTPINPATGLLRNISGGNQYASLYKGTTSARGHQYN